MPSSYALTCAVLKHNCSLLGSSTADTVARCTLPAAALLMLCCVQV
jgi:hypothetical protein